MKRTTSLLALSVLPLALFTGCTKSNEDAAPEPTAVVQVEETTTEPEPTMPEKFPWENVTGTDENGTTYTLGPIQPFPDETRQAMDDAGVLFEEGVTLDGLRMACVDVDNTSGGGEAKVTNLTAVTDDGVTHEFRTMGDYLFEVSETVDYNADYDSYMVLFDLSQSESGKETIAPTAKSTVCLPVDPTIEGMNFTYIEVSDGAYSTPLYPAI